MWELDYKEGWAPKNWCFWTVVLEKTLESPLDYKEIQPVHPKGNQSWILTGRTDAEAPILWSPDTKSQLISKDPDAAKDWGQEQKGMTEDEMIGWHHGLNGHEFDTTPGDGKTGMLQSQRVGHDWVNNNKEVINMSFIHKIYFLRSLQANLISFLYSKTSWSR